MKKSNVTLLAAISIAMAFTVSCSSGDTNQGKFCIYTTTQECFSTSSDSCPAGGELSDFCPFSTQKSSSSFGSTYGKNSSSSNNNSSSSNNNNNSSSSTVSNNSSNSNVIVVGEFTDSRDQKKYKLVVIGTQFWMAENLNYDANGSKCYDNDPSNCATYGRLYNWETANAVCPSGWHLPSDEDWTTLTNYVGASAGSKLKAASGWNSVNGNGSDAHGFSALPGGYGDSFSFYNVGLNGYWWSSTDVSATNAYYRNMNYNYGDVGRGSLNKSNLYSVRCTLAQENPL